MAKIINMKNMAANTTVTASMPGVSMAKNMSIVAANIRMINMMVESMANTKVMMNTPTANTIPAPMNMKVST